MCLRISSRLFSGSPAIVGVLVVAGCPFPLEEERINISMLADLLSMALQNASLLDPTRDGKWVDQLTGVSNRIYFLQRFESEIRRTENYRQALALFMFDIDEFKKINDTHGHYAGDVVIKRMAEIVRKNTRGYDLVGRYGGDEFMVLITSTTEEQAISFAEHLREKISTTDIAIPGNEVPVRITISGGLAMFPDPRAVYHRTVPGRRRRHYTNRSIREGTGSWWRHPSDWTAGSQRVPTQIRKLPYQRTFPRTPDRMPSNTPSGNSVKI